MDVFAAPGSAVYAPLQGTVHAFADNTTRLDYGPVVILRHAFRDGSDKKGGKNGGEEQEFFTLYGHLTRDTLQNTSGASHAAGEKSRASEACRRMAAGHRIFIFR